MTVYEDADDHASSGTQGSGQADSGLPKTPVASTTWTAPGAVSLGLLQVAIFWPQRDDKLPVKKRWHDDTW